jgi:hypothetical protein
MSAFSRLTSNDFLRIRDALRHSIKIAAILAANDSVFSDLTCRAHYPIATNTRIPP